MAEDSVPPTEGGGEEETWEQGLPEDEHEIRPGPKGDLLRELEETILGGTEEKIRAIIRVRKEDLYKERNYATFDDYVEEQTGYTRQWVTKQTHKVEAEDHLAEVAGNDRYQFTASAVAPIAYLLKEDPDRWLAIMKAAAVEEDQKQGKKTVKVKVVREKAVKEALALSDQQRHLQAQLDEEAEREKIPEEERIKVSPEQAALLSPLDRWDLSSFGVNLVDRAVALATREGGTWYEKLAELCAKEGQFPLKTQILKQALATGMGLGEVMKHLGPVIEAKVTEASRREEGAAKIRALETAAKAGSKTTREEIAKLQKQYGLPNPRARGRKARAQPEEEQVPPPAPAEEKRQRTTEELVEEILQNLAVAFEKYDYNDPGQQEAIKPLIGKLNDWAQKLKSWADYFKSA
jgi:hypothetical protein